MDFHVRISCCFSWHFRHSLQAEVLRAHSYSGNSFKRIYYNLKLW